MSIRVPATKSDLPELFQEEASEEAIALRLGALRMVDDLYEKVLEGTVGAFSVTMYHPVSDAMSSNTCDTIGDVVSSPYFTGQLAMHILELQMGNLMDSGKLKNVFKR